MILAATLFLLDSLIIWLLASGRGRWQLKLVALILACTVNFGVISAFRYGNGYPTGPMQQPVLVIYCYAIPPGGTHPAVYIWGIPQTTQHHVLGYDITTAPRSYELPYTLALAKQCDKANKAGQQGQPVEVARKGKKGKKKARTGVQDPNFHFYSEPPKLFDPKTK